MSYKDIFPKGRGIHTSQACSHLETQNMSFITSTGTDAKRSTGLRTRRFKTLAPESRKRHDGQLSMTARVKHSTNAARRVPFDRPPAPHLPATRGATRGAERAFPPQKRCPSTAMACHDPLVPRTCEGTSTKAGNAAPSLQKNRPQDEKCGDEGDPILLASATADRSMSFIWPNV